jgi:CRP-like cAMP-binding protein
VARALLVLRRALRDRAETAGDRIRVARAYRVLGDTVRAAGWYRSAVDELSANGDAVKALALAKEMAEVAPQEQRAFAALADRFSSSGRDAGRVAVPVIGIAQPLEAEEDHGRVLDASELLRVYEAETLGASAEAPLDGLLPSLVPPDVLEELHVRGEIDLYDPEGKLLVRPEDEAIEVSEEDIELIEDAEHEVDPEEVIEKLQQVPLFSDLDRDAFLELSRAVKLRTVGDRCYVFKEGEEANSFFLVAEGSLEVIRRLRKREVLLRRFGAGEPFGLFGLFAGKKRAGSARAVGNCSVLEIPAGALANVIRTHPKARVALSRFFKARLLENFLASSPIFEDLDVIARGLLIGQFRQKKLSAGDKVVSPGEVFNGLFLVVAGRLTITKRLVSAREEELAQLERGQFFGIVSALSGTPCRCNIAAVEETTLTYLPQRSFNDFVRDFPSLRELPRRLATEGMLVDKDVFVGDSGIPGLS